MEHFKSLKMETVRILYFVKYYSEYNDKAKSMVRLLGSIFDNVS